jgi:hypothetical protein
MLVLRYKRLTATFIVLSIAYFVLSITLPLNKAALTKYHLTSGQDIILTLTITLPYLIIWGIALIGYLRFKAYSDAIKESRDGAAFHTISSGLLWLALWLPLSAVVGTITSGYYRGHVSSTPEMVSLNNYISVIILFIAFWRLQIGSRQLIGSLRKPNLRLPQLMTMLFISFSALYLLLVLHDPARQFPTRSVPVASYYLPDWLTVLTIVIPTLITWQLGMQALFNIYLYRNNVKGRIYKDAFNNLGNGFTSVIVVLVVLRCFESLSSHLTKLSLGPILLIVYLLLIALSIGYILIFRGARSLHRIEEI